MEVDEANAHSGMATNAYRAPSVMGYQRTSTCMSLFVTAKYTKRDDAHGPRVAPAKCGRGHVARRGAEREHSDDCGPVERLVSPCGNAVSGQRAFRLHFRCTHCTFPCRPYRIAGVPGSELEARQLPCQLEDTLMKSPNVHGVAIAGAILFLFTSASASAAQRAACSVLTLVEVRAIVGGQVVVFDAGSAAPATRNEMTISNCTYTLPNGNGPSARVTLMWAPSAKLAETNTFYLKRNKELPSIKGNVLVLASVTGVKNGDMTFDRAASQKLLAAVLKKL
jgi:hypothetical protein